mmetsp:Transcript_50629/g.99594  ORF Transcript_50629/g.99594 Transcript_50629/m.99594 type:complete len:333 (+) Transcript_50629:187-1185(+)
MEVWIVCLSRASTLLHKTEHFEPFSLQLLQLLFPQIKARAAAPLWPDAPVIHVSHQQRPLFVFLLSAFVSRLFCLQRVNALQRLQTPEPGGPSLRGPVSHPVPGRGNAHEGPQVNRKEAAAPRLEHSSGLSEVQQVHHRVVPSVLPSILRHPRPWAQRPLLQLPSRGDAHQGGDRAELPGLCVELGADLVETPPASVGALHHVRVHLTPINTLALPVYLSGRFLNSVHLLLAIATNTKVQGLSKVSEVGPTEDAQMCELKWVQERKDAINEDVLFLHAQERLRIFLFFLFLLILFPMWFLLGYFHRLRGVACVPLCFFSHQCGCVHCRRTVR